MGYCLLAYVVLVHLSIVLDRPALAGLALGVLAASFLWKPLAARRSGAWLGLLAACAFSAWTVHIEVTRYALYFPPVALPLMMLVWWGGSLRAGETPFVTRIATLVRGGDLSPEYAAYTRRVTQLWVGVFAVLAALALGLAAWASPETWSLFTNFLNNLFVGLVFVCEYLYRRVRFRHLPHPDFITFVREVARVGVRKA